MAHDSTARGRKINLLIAVEGLGIGGAEVVIQRLAQTLDRSRFNLVICCLKDQGAIGEELARDGVEIVVLRDPSDTRVDYFTFLKLRKLIREKRIDVVHTHTADALAEAALCKLLSPRIKLIHTFHFGNYPHRRNPELWMERLFSRVANRLLAVGEVQRQQLRRVFGFGDRAVGRVWNGVNFSAPKPANLAEAGAKRPLLVGTIATLIEQKGLFDLLAVAKRVSEKRNDIRFVIVGEGALRPRLEAMRKEMGLDDVVTLAGWVKDAARVTLPTFDIFFQPSLWEAMSIALLEAMAAARPIVTTRVGENPHVIEDGVDGLIVEPKDIDGMAAALRRLADDPELRARMGSAAARKAERQFTVEHMTRAYEEIYASTARR